MAYGKIKADAIIRDNGGSDEEITMATIVGLDSDKAPKASPTFTGTVTLPATTALAGQASDVTIIDNNAAALEVKEGSTAYVTFDTTNSSEQIEVAKKVQLAEDLEFSAAKDILIPDNQATGLEIKEGSNAYMTFDTTDSSEKVSVQKAFDCDSTLNVDGVSTLNDHLNLTAQKELRLQDSSGGEYVAIKAPATVAANVTLTLPNTDGDADQLLQTNGSGVLSWASVSGGYTWLDEVAWDGAHTFTSIPTTVTEILLVWKETYSSGSTIDLQLGGASSWVTSGYETVWGYNATTNAETTSFKHYVSNHEFSGHGYLTRGGDDNNEWVYVWDGIMHDTSNNVYFGHTYGHVDLGSQELTRLDLTGTGTATGAISLGYK